VGIGIYRSNGEIIDRIEKPTGWLPAREMVEFEPHDESNNCHDGQVGGSKCHHGGTIPQPTSFLPRGGAFGIEHSFYIRGSIPSPRANSPGS
jgi:hypothetical protein